MDSNGENKNTVDESDLTETELKELNEAFKALGVKPKTKSAAELRQWMAGYTKSTQPDDRRSEQPLRRESQSNERDPGVTKHDSTSYA